MAQGDEVVSFILIQARDDGGLHLAGNSVGDEKWSDSGYTLNVEQQGFLRDWLWFQGRLRYEKPEETVDVN